MGKMFIISSDLTSLSNILCFPSMIRVNNRDTGGKVLVLVLSIDTEIFIDSS